MTKQHCAICGPKVRSKLIYRQNFNINSLNEKIFSARRLPDKIHYQMVRCKKCGLLYSNPVLTQKELLKFYKKSGFTYQKQIRDLKDTYSTYLRKASGYLFKQGNYLDIGCGNGFMLTVALNTGYERVFGVEPSQKAIAKSAKSIRMHIKNDIFKEGLFPNNYIDLITIFQTFDHLPNPNRFLKDCFNALRPGGVLLAFNHDESFILAKILGERFPIIDVEHTYLYNQRTMSRIFKKNKFKVLEVGYAKNIYSVDYLIRMFPTDPWIKRRIMTIANILKLDKLRINVPIGNLYLIAQK